MQGSVKETGSAATRTTAGSTGLAVDLEDAPGGCGRAQGPLSGGLGFPCTLNNQLRTVAV